MFQSYEYIYIQKTDVNCKTDIVIDRYTGLLKEVEKKSIEDINALFSKQCSLTKFSTLMGIIHVEEYSFLVYIPEVHLVCDIIGKPIYEVQSVKLEAINVVQNKDGKFQYRYEANSNYEEIQNLKDKMKEIGNILQKGIYYSEQYSLTLSQQRSTQQSTIEKQFCFNYQMLYDFRTCDIKQTWHQPFIQGFVGSFNTLISGCTFYLISRRSWLRGGTRYNHRGADLNGNAANYVETEQILIQKDSEQGKNHIASFVQIRGSIPLIWEQQGLLKGNLVLHEQDNLQQRVFDSHFQIVKEDYQNSHIINLLQKASESELKLTQLYEDYIQKCKYRENLSYSYFDFHTECKGNKFYFINEFLKRNEKKIKQEYQLYFEVCKEDDTKQIQIQSGVVRTNCLDCLDRTNVVQMRIGALMLEEMFKTFDISLSERNIIKYKKTILDQLDEQNTSSLFIDFKHEWADMGDMISQIYAGTGASTTQITKTGNQGFLEKSLKGVHRFFNEKFTDDFKQECYEIIWGKYNGINVQGKELQNNISQN